MEQIKLEEMIDYHGGLLNEEFTKAIVSLYDHVRNARLFRVGTLGLMFFLCFLQVISEGDDRTSPNCIYNAQSSDDMKLP
jgi:hypothetical protein